jgi:hypothetical protein
MDDDLEVFVASGLDVPTSIVLAEQGGKPPERRRGCGTIIIIAVVLAVLSLLWRLL